MKILLIESNETLSLMISSSLQKAFNADVVVEKSSQEALKRLNDGETYSLFLVRNFISATKDSEEDLIAHSILNHIYDKSLKTPLVVIGEFDHAFKKYALVSEHFRIEEINRLILKALGLKKENFSQLKLPDYVSYSLKHFYFMTSTPCDIYIKLIKKTGDEYVRRLSVGESFSRKDLEKYEELGLKEFYVLKEDFEVFINDHLSQTLANLKIDRPCDENYEVVKDSFELSAELLLELGITPEVVAVVQQNIQLIKNQIQKTDKLSLLLKKILDDNTSYAFQRPYLICLLSHLLLPKMEWGSGDQQPVLLEKICMVSFFHDIYLDSESLLKINDYESFKKASLAPKEKNLVLNHANKAALLLQSYPKLPQGIDLIIKQHHGVSNGIGFPEVLTSAISPMAIFFIVVEEFATLILENSNDEKSWSVHIKQSIEPLKIKFQLPSYRKIVNEIESVFHSKKSS